MRLHHDCQNDGYRISSRYVRNISASVYLLRSGSKVCRYCGKPCSESFSCGTVEISRLILARYHKQSTFSFCNFVTCTCSIWHGACTSTCTQVVKISSRRSFYEELFHSWFGIGPDSGCREHGVSVCAGIKARAGSTGAADPVAACRPQHAGFADLGTELQGIHGHDREGKGRDDAEGQRLEHELQSGR